MDPIGRIRQKSWGLSFCVFRCDAFLWQPFSHSATRLPLLRLMAKKQKGQRAKGMKVSAPTVTTSTTSAAAGPVPGVWPLIFFSLQYASFAVIFMLTC